VQFGRHHLAIDFLQDILGCPAPADPVQPGKGIIPSIVSASPSRSENTTGTIMPAREVKLWRLAVVLQGTMFINPACFGADRMFTHWVKWEKQRFINNTII